MNETLLNFTLNISQMGMNPTLQQFKEIKDYEFVRQYCNAYSSSFAYILICTGFGILIPDFLYKFNLITEPQYLWCCKRFNAWLAFGNLAVLLMVRWL